MFRDQIPPESYNKLASRVVVEKVLSTRGREISRHPCNYRTHVTIERGEPRVCPCVRDDRDIVRSMELPAEPITAN